MKKNVLYIHGFGSGAASTTPKIIQEVMFNYNIISVDVFHQYQKSIDIIEQTIVDEDIDIIIGTSLGGLYTLCTKFDGIKIAINPVLNVNDLKPLIGKHTYFVKRENGDTEFEFTNNDLREIKNNMNFYLTENTFIIESTHDELLGNNINIAENLLNKFDINGDNHVITTDKIGHRLTINFVKRDFRYIVNDIINDLSNDKLIFNSPDLENDDIILENTEYNKKKELDEYQYLNLWTDNNTAFSHSNDVELKEKYCDEVWNLLQKAYEKIGGCSSFDDKNEMMTKADLWKLKIRSGKVVAAILYTTKKGGGRKIIAAASLKSNNAIEAEQSKNDLIKMLKDDIKLTNRNTWAEVSGTIEYYFRKFGAAAIPADKAKLILAKKSKSIIDINDININDIENKADIEKIPNRSGEHYVRSINGKLYRKAMLGNYNDDLALESKIIKAIKRGLNEALNK